MEQKLATTKEEVDALVTKVMAMPVEEVKQMNKKRIEELMNEEMQSVASDALKEIASDGDAPSAARVAAANSILDRTVGKPKETMEIHNKGGMFMTPAEYEAAWLQLEKERRVVGSGVKEEDPHDEV